MNFINSFNIKLSIFHLQENYSMAGNPRDDGNNMVEEGKNSQFMEVLYKKKIVCLHKLGSLRFIKSKYQSIFF